MHSNTQYIAFYNGDSNVVLDKRQPGTTNRHPQTTQHKGNTEDARNCICIVAQLTGAFCLSDGGTKRIPISRPQVVARKDGAIYVICRDEERGNVISLATFIDSAHQKWRITELLKDRVGSWEPTLDGNLWTRKGQLDLSGNE